VVSSPSYSLGGGPTATVAASGIRPWLRASFSDLSVYKEMLLHFAAFHTIDESMDFLPLDEVPCLSDKDLVGQQIIGCYKFL
jgi:hypothetical protein